MKNKLNFFLFFSNSLYIYISRLFIFYFYLNGTLIIILHFILLRVKSLLEILKNYLSKVKKLVKVLTDLYIKGKYIYFQFNHLILLIYNAFKELINKQMRSLLLKLLI